MDMNISPLFRNVNKHTVLLYSLSQNKLAYMKYGERLKLARGAMTQAKLSELANVKQSLISQLENSPTATGSQYTGRLARALGVSPEWLADEEGEMKPTRYSTSDPALIEILQVMMPRPDYDKVAVLKAMVATLEQVDHAVQAAAQAQASSDPKNDEHTLSDPARTINFREKRREIDRRNEVSPAPRKIEDVKK